MGCAEDTVEAVRVGVNCPEARERTQEGGEEGGSGAVRKRVCRDVGRRTIKQCMAPENLKQKASKGDGLEHIKTRCRESLKDVVWQNKGERSVQSVEV